MHSCPDCDQACYCDCEDTGLDAPDDCCHQCDVHEDEADDMGIPAVTTLGARKAWRTPTFTLLGPTLVQSHAVKGRGPSKLP